MDYSSYFPVKITTKSHDEFIIQCLPAWKVQKLKWAIFDYIKKNYGRELDPKEQRLFFEGIEIEEHGYELASYGIEPLESGDGGAAEFRITLTERFKGIPQTYFLDEAHYDAKWNCSYQGIRERKQHYRGDKLYQRPIGCVRYGIKVLNKYENNSWLGEKGLRTEGEWPVAYHGTKELNVLDILKQGFLISKGQRFAYGKGIYCTPDPRVALGYAHQYCFNGEQYQLIIQCRVDPQKLQIHPGNYWLVTEESHIRPYAICVYSQDGMKELQLQYGPPTQPLMHGQYVVQQQYPPQ